MTQDEIDTMWQQAMQDSIKDGEMYTRYHFAKLVAEAEREACAELIEKETGLNPNWQKYLSAAIRARGQA